MVKPLMENSSEFCPQKYDPPHGIDPVHLPGLYCGTTVFCGLSTSEPKSLFARRGEYRSFSCPFSPLIKIFPKHATNTHGLVYRMIQYDLNIVDERLLLPVGTSYWL